MNECDISLIFVSPSYYSSLVFFWYNNSTFNTILCSYHSKHTNEGNHIYEILLRFAKKYAISKSWCIHSSAISYEITKTRLSTSSKQAPLGHFCFITTGQPPVQQDDILQQGHQNPFPEPIPPLPPSCSSCPKRSTLPELSHSARRDWNVVFCKMPGYRQIVL